VSSPRPETTAQSLIDDFLLRTGLEGDVPPSRYLWTDAFAVCSLLGQWRRTGERRRLDSAMELADQVHRVLGRHRPDDGRSGWISGLPEKEGAAHPTVGGLRIGKPLPERGPEEAPDPGREWDRDGQYFHYLTRWIHALDLMGRHTGQSRYTVWAAELAATSGRAFMHSGTPRRRSMHWKMSIDLSRPLVPSMGSHDPLDGYVRCRQVLATLRSIGAPDEAFAGELSKVLEEQTLVYLGMMRGRSLATPDPLGTGGLLCACVHLHQIADPGSSTERAQVARLLRDALSGLEVWMCSGSATGPAEKRLPFRELGLALGLSGVGVIRREGSASIPGTPYDTLLGELERRAPLGDEITSFWNRRENRGESWNAHREINQVMLAAALDPLGYLLLPGPGGCGR
jgi:hypothetical protein